MKNKKYFACAVVATALFINCPQVSADKVETFGADFESENNSVNAPFQKEFSDDADFGETLVFNKTSKNNSENPAPVETVETPPVAKPVVETPTVEKPVVENVQQKNNFDEENTVVVIEKPATSNNEKILPPSRVNERLRDNEKKKRLKTQKARFIKLAMDDTYSYYLDKQSVSWRRVPYSASEYMLDVWIRMIEINPDNSDLPDDLAEYINDTSNGEISVAEEKGKKFNPVDTDVLQHKKFFLEHYYLRPKTKQIQFLSELEVVGHPQNTISERAYDYKNWEYLVPGSIESVIYNMTMKEVGKSGSSENGHMTFADYLEEYARISIR